MRKLALMILVTAVVTILGVADWVLARNDMSEKNFEFEIGKTLQETGAQTRLPLSGDNDLGLISASPPMFPDGVYGIYAKKGFELKVGPLSWIMFYSDTWRYSNKLVNIASLSISTKQPGFSTHAQVYDYVYALIDQFQRGKWQRYIPEICPRLYGKASILDDEEIRALATPDVRNWVAFDCPVDPAYKPGLDEWKLLAKDLLQYKWHDGEGRIAKLVVHARDANEEGKLGPFDVQINLEFELEESIKAREAYNRESELKERWGARVPKVEAEKRRIRDLLEQRAGKPAASLDQQALPLRAKAGQPCPRTGFWKTQSNEIAKCYYKEGELMPDLGSSYGFTIWEWVG